MTYYYDALDRVSGMVDALNHSTNFRLQRSRPGYM